MKEKLRLPCRRSQRFYNTKTEKEKDFYLPSICMLFGSCMYRACDLFRDPHTWVAKEKPIDKSKKLAITWIGHSTFLIQVGDINILIDPVFANVSWLFPRLLPAGIALDELPPIDIVLISHNHRDHMERSSLLTLKKHNPHVLVPLGDKAWFDYHEFDHVFELNWWEQKKIVTNNQNSSLKITFLPADHWSQRTFFDKNQSLWGSWMIECDGYTLYFAGDTTYSSHFIEIAQEFSQIDVTFLPIGPCEPYRWLKSTHLNAQEAGKAFLDLNAKHMFPMHWGTFHFGVELFDLPIKRLQSWYYENNDSLTEKVIHLPKVGKRIYI